MTPAFSLKPFPLNCSWLAAALNNIAKTSNQNVSLFTARLCVFNTIIDLLFGDFGLDLLYGPGPLGPYGPGPLGPYGPGPLIILKNILG